MMNTSRPKLTSRRAFWSSVRTTLKKKSSGLKKNCAFAFLSDSDISILFKHLPLMLSLVEKRSSEEDLLNFTLPADRIVSNETKEKTLEIVDALSKSNKPAILKGLKGIPVSMIVVAIKIAFICYSKPLVPCSVTTELLNSIELQNTDTPTAMQSAVERFRKIFQPHAMTDFSKLLATLCRSLHAYSMPTDELAYIFASFALLPTYTMLSTETIVEEEKSANFSLLARADDAVELMEFMITNSEKLFDDSFVSSPPANVKNTRVIPNEGQEVFLKKKSSDNNSLKEEPNGNSPEEGQVEDMYPGQDISHGEESLKENQHEDGLSEKEIVPESESAVEKLPVDQSLTETQLSRDSSNQEYVTDNELLKENTPKYELSEGNQSSCATLTQENTSEDEARKENLPESDSLKENHSRSDGSSALVDISEDETPRKNEYSVDWSPKEGNLSEEDPSRENQYIGDFSKQDSHSGDEFLRDNRPSDGSLKQDNASKDQLSKRNSTENDSIELSMLEFGFTAEDVNRNGPRISGFENDLLSVSLLEDELLESLSEIRYPEENILENDASKENVPESQLLENNCPENVSLKSCTSENDMLKPKKLKSDSLSDSIAFDEKNRKNSGISSQRHSVEIGSPVVLEKQTERRKSGNSKTRSSFSGVESSLGASDRVVRRASATNVPSKSLIGKRDSLTSRKPLCNALTACQYEAQNEGEISVAKGDSVEVLLVRDSNCCCRKGNEVGTVPLYILRDCDKISSLGLSEDNENNAIDFAVEGMVSRDCQVYEAGVAKAVKKLAAFVGVNVSDAVDPNSKVEQLSMLIDSLIQEMKTKNGRGTVLAKKKSHKSSNRSKSSLPKSKANR